MLSERRYEISRNVRKRLLLRYRLAATKDEITNCVLHFCKHRPTKVIIYVRDSTSTQQANLRNQERFLCARLKEQGVEIIKTTKVVTSGQRNADRQRLIEAAREAELNNGYVVAIVLNRYIRPLDYDRTKPYSSYLTKDDIDWLHRIGRGRLMTYYPPTLSEQEQRSILIKLSRPGRPSKKPKGWRVERFERLFAKVFFMSRVGMSYNSIAKHLNITKSLVQYWANYRPKKPRKSGGIVFLTRRKSDVR